MVSSCSSFCYVQLDCKGLWILKDNGCGFISGGLGTLCNLLGRENWSGAGMCWGHSDILTGKMLSDM